VELLHLQLAGGALELLDLVRAGLSLPVLVTVTAFELVVMGRRGRGEVGEAGDSWAPARRLAPSNSKSCTSKPSGPWAASSRRRGDAPPVTLVTVGP